MGILFLGGKNMRIPCGFILVDNGALAIIPIDRVLKQEQRSDITTQCVSAAEHGNSYTAMKVFLLTR